MNYTKQDALVSLKPTASYTWIGDDYSGLNWLGSGSAPTDAEITAELNRLNAAEPVRPVSYTHLTLPTICSV